MQLLAVAVTAALFLLPSAASAQTTYQGPTYDATVTTGPTADKPQSKLWFQDGTWWAIMLGTGTNKYSYIHKLQSDHTWLNTGSLVDNRPTTQGDALWDGNKLYVASRVSSGPGMLARFSYNAATKSYSMDAGFPVKITPGGSESLTVAKDSTGRLWATYTRGSPRRVYVTHSTTSDAVWATPFVVPGATAATTLASDDISAVVALPGKIGVMWSNQTTETMHFATHTDGAPPTTWNAVETAYGGSQAADDHINLKNIIASDDGRLFAAVKTSRSLSSEANVVLLVRTSTGSWTNHVYTTNAYKSTRPLVLLDESSRKVYVFATAPEAGGTVYYKSTSMDAISFASGRGSPFVTWPGAKINNATSTKDPVNSTTGIVVLASDASTDRYYHAELGR